MGLKSGGHQACTAKVQYQLHWRLFLVAPNAAHLFIFFFSSRRRHTRSKRDWSSDVCSSDLGDVEALADAIRELLDDPGALARAREGARRAREELTWDAAARTHLDLYEELR